MSTLARDGLALLLAILLPACSDKKDWDTEVIVQVFKPKLLDLPKVQIEAVQGARNGKLELTNPFQSCSSNQVRIIPAPGGPEMTITATAGQLTARATVKPSQASVKLVLGGLGPDLQPSACAPENRIDAAIQRQTAEPCTRPQECLGGVCIEKIANVHPNEPVFKGGYCSTDCSADKSLCAPDEECTDFRNGLNVVVKSYCILKCGKESDAGISSRCRTADYFCTTGDLCYPNP